MAARLDLHFPTHAQASIQQGSGHDRAESGECEHSVNREPGRAQIPPTGSPVQQKIQPLDQPPQTLLGPNGNAVNGRLLQPRPGEKSLHLNLNQLDPLRTLGQIDLGERHRTLLHTQEVYDSQMLPGLRHHPFVCRHHEQDGVDPSHSRQHVVDEVLMTRDIDNAHHLARGKSQPGKAQIDGHLPLFFLSEPIGIDAREGLHQAGFAVIDVSSCPENPPGRRGHFSPRSHASSPSAKAFSPAI